MCCGHICVPTARVECLLRASAPQEHFKPPTSTREERAEGSPCSLWAGLQYNKLPSLFAPVETSDHAVSFYISDGIFSHVALCCNGTSTHENTHGKLYEDSGGDRGGVGRSLSHYRPAGNCFRNFQSSLTAYIFFRVWLNIYITFWPGGDAAPIACAYLFA